MTSKPSSLAENPSREGITTPPERYTLEDVETHRVLDTKIVLETPEGAELELRPAGFLSRGIALVIDEFLKLLIYLIFMLLLTVISSQLGSAAEEIASALVLIVFFAVTWFYGVVFEQLNKGRTPGKVVSSVQVTNADGTPVGFMQSVVRNLFRTVDSLFLSMPGLMLLGLVPALIPLGLPGLFFVLFSKNFRRLGDHLADTIVIHTSQSKTKAHEGGVTPVILPANLAMEDQRLILSFQDRFEEFSDERKVELAEMLKPLHGQNGEDAVETCLAYANSIRGTV